MDRIRNSLAITIPSHWRFQYHKVGDDPEGGKTSLRWHLWPKWAGPSIFVSVYLIIILYVRHNSLRDPTSAFFSPNVGYQSIYSSVRLEQASNFIDNVPDIPRNGTTDTTGKRLCVGVPSIARDDARYFRTTVGSILDALTQKERDEIYLILFVAHTDQATHPAWNEPWLRATADQLLSYDFLPSEEYAHIVELEKEGGLHREKALFDYTYLMRACSRIKPAHIAIFEDDTLALEGWYYRTQQALDIAQQRFEDFLYLRLFFTEQFLGWNAEYWSTYLFNSVLLIVGAIVILQALRSLLPQRTEKIFTNRNIALTAFVFVPFNILLLFAAGRVTIVGGVSPGVREMNSFGCCAQALVYPYDKAQDLIHWHTEKRVGFVDSLTEEYADEHDERRLVLSPAVVQHIGRVSSKEEGLGGKTESRIHAAKIWNFEFEENDAAKLKQEHQEAEMYS